MKKLYLITGAAGHLGSTIIRCLRERDCLIRGLLLPGETGEDDRQIRYYRGDVTKERSMDAFFGDTEGYETLVIHAAGLISIGKRPPENLRLVNVTGTANVIAQCRRHWVKRLEYVSSVHAIPDQGEKAVRETLAFDPGSVEGAYAKTKAEASRLVVRAGETGLDTVIVHPSGIIGPYDDGQNHVVQLFRLAVQRRLPVGVTGGYDFVDVRDVAAGCVAAAERGRRGGSYILSNRYATVKELLDLYADNVGRRRYPIVPLALAKAVAPFFGLYAKMKGLRPLFTPYALRTLGWKGTFSHGLASAELGYRPRSLEETVIDTVGYLKAALARDRVV